MKKAIKRRIAYIWLMLATILVAFNNAGQFLTFINIPFSRTSQIYIGVISIVISFIWYSYLEGAIK